MIIDYEHEKLTGLGDTITVVTGQQISPVIIDLGRQALQRLDVRYGPESDNPLGFHYGPHSLGVARRNIFLANLLYDFIPEEQQQGIFDSRSGRRQHARL